MSMPSGSRRHSGGRRSKQREIRPAFHILCEGQNTEPEYFKQFPINNIAHCQGYARSNTALVKEALKHKRKEGIKKDSPDQVWVVFDYDVNPKIGYQKQDFNAAIELAAKNNIHCAFSNDSFELWFVLHFQDCRAQQLRDWYCDKMIDHIGEYGKDKKIARSIYGKIIESQPKAIKRAIKLLEEQRHQNPANMNPCTTVHLLVEELNKFI